MEQLNLKLIDIPEAEINDLKTRLAKTYEGSAIPDEEQKNYYTNKEEEMCYADRRGQIMTLLLRSRILVARIHSK